MDVRKLLLAALLFALGYATMYVSCDSRAGSAATQPAPAAAPR